MSISGCWLAAVYGRSTYLLTGTLILALGREDEERGKGGSMTTSSSLIHAIRQVHLSAFQCQKLSIRHQTFPPFWISRPQRNGNGKA